MIHVVESLVFREVSDGLFDLGQVLLDQFSGHAEIILEAEFGPEVFLDSPGAVSASGFFYKVTPELDPDGSLDVRVDRIEDLLASLMYIRKEFLPVHASSLHVRDGGFKMAFPHG